MTARFRHEFDNVLHFAGKTRGHRPRLQWDASDLSDGIRRSSEIRVESIL